MEAPESNCSAPAARDQPAPAPGPPGPPAGQASPHLTLSPVILPPEQGLPSTVLLKALPIPLYHTVPPGGLQPRAPLVTGSLDGSSVPFILSPLLQTEGPGPTQAGKPAAPTLTVNIVGALPVLSPGLGPTLGSPGKSRNAGRYLCPHCGRDCLKPSVLEKHIRSHTGERPFPCATCHIAFKTQSNLYKHRRTQTHLNNSRLSLESDGGGSSLPEEGDRVGDLSTADGSGESRNQRMGEGAPETPLSPDAPLSLVAKNQGVKAEAASCPGSTLAHRETSLDSTQMASPGILLASMQPPRKLPELKSCSLQRQQEASSEKPGEAKVPEGRLRKCESTDSGYLSRSDSAEQPPVPSSPLHSLSEHSAESEGEGGLGTGSGGTRAEPGVPGSSLELEKKRLEERIAQLISHNQAVVDDPQLDHVRPRKTVLSKQGSIDLPMPYTYKDSFHFDIRALEPGRRRAALSPAHSTFTPLDKLRPLFFHSVPTQLSTTVEYVPITRSNSLPFVEGSRTWPEPRALKDACPRTQKPLSPRPTPARLGCRSGLTLADVPSGHPRALVRQAAVEDVPCALAGDTPALTEDPGGKRTVTAAGASWKGRATSKKGGQRKLKMFSQEKWQMYGHETFRKLYQKVKSSHQGGQKAREVRVGCGTDPALPAQEEAVGGESTVPSQDSRTPILEGISAEAKPESWGSLPAPEGSLETEPPKQRKAEARVGGSDQPRAASSPTLSSRGSPHSGNRSPLLPPNEGLETGWQLPPAPGPLQGGDLGVPRLALPASKVEGGIPGAGGMQETGPCTQLVLRRPSGNSGEPWPAEDKHPSERKKLKVDEQGPLEQPGLLGAETPGGPVQASSVPCQKQDGDHGEMPGGTHGSAHLVAEALDSSDASSTAPVASPSWAGPGDKEPTSLAAAKDRGHHSHLGTPPQAPGVLAALAEGAFPPKYLLKVPQGEIPSALLATQRPQQGQDSLCTIGPPEEQASLVGPGLGTPWSLSTGSGPTSGGADGILEHPSWSRPRDGGQESQMGREKREGTDSRVPAARESPGSTTGPHWEMTSFPDTPSYDAHVAQDAGSEVHAIHRLCMGSTLARSRTSEGVLNLWTPSGDLGGPHEHAPESLSSEPPALRTPCCSLQPGSFLRALTRPQGMSLSQPERALSLHLGTPRSCGAQSPFPSLRAEPRLTWCCLSRSLPLPMEQKEKAASVYEALHFPGGRLQDAGPDALPVSNRGRTRRSPGGGELVQTPQLSNPIVPGMRSQDQPSDPERKKGLFRRRVKTSRGNSKQKRLKINPKRYEGNFWQSRAPSRTSRLRKPPWVPRSCPRLRLEGPEPHGILKNSGLNLQGDLATSEFSLGYGNEEEKEDDCGRISENASPSSSSRTVRERDKLTAKDISPSAGKHDGCSQQHDTAALSGLSLQVDTCVAVAKDDPMSRGKGLEAGYLEAQLPPSQGSVSGHLKPCVSSDAQEPPSYESKGTFPHHDIATSVAAICISVGVAAGHTVLGMHSAEPQEHSCAAGETLAQSSPDRRAITEGISQTPLPAKLASGHQTVGSVPLASTGKVHLEIPALGLSSTCSHQEEGRPQVAFPSRGQHGCGQKAFPCPTIGTDSGKCQVSGLITRKGCGVSSNPGQPSEVPEAPSRSVRKRSLEGMRKQTRVELSDSSSDDEDRLVIEL
ncbi:zinc finger protein 831 isoform X1 [Marmota marmota marmota]|uniref:zinc finger protein 831 isoform X1 n=1 Tax=Marmota marmota marmota TaxID=9994 RepID=UPI002092505C|nr:zinc finger protein 831 isoform X1 [Marmota marmota marmota]XP_048666852.1 zinc finger protein 831 isoform X1 [Marmota marmota marmota]XP_048666853.1 zinc finger protein 831 isoform X1 [Marmota marmota marmota]